MPSRLFICKCSALITFANNYLDQDQARQIAEPDQGPNCLTLCWCSCKNLFQNVNYTPGIYADGYIAFICLFIHFMGVRSFILPSDSWNLPQTFLLKFLKCPGSTADLHLCFPHAKQAGFLMTWLKSFCYWFMAKAHGPL